MLFDSLLRDFPIGQMLVKKTKVDDLEDKPTYKFVKNYVTDDLESFDDANHNNPKVDNIDKDPIKLVFDGQQRLTALNIGLNGFIYERDSKYSNKDKDNYIKKYLCMNIISDPDKQVSDAESFDQSKGGEAPIYEFSFRSKQNHGRSGEKFWYPVKRMNRYDSLSDVTSYVDESEIYGDNEDKARDNLIQLYQKIKNRECIDIKTVRNKSNNQMLEIFLRMNRSGTKISRKDTCLSILTYKWQDKDIIARESIENYVNKINKQFDSGRNPINEKIILNMLKACALHKSNVDSYKPTIRIEELTSKKSDLSEKMLETWKGNFKKVVEKYIELYLDLQMPLNRIGSLMTFGPIIAYLYKNHPVELDKESNDGLLNRQKILFNISCGVVLGYSDRASSRKAAESIEAVYNSTKDSYPLQEIINGMSSERPLKFNTNITEIRDFNIEFYNSQDSKLIGKLLHIHRSSKRQKNELKEYHKDHIYCKSNTRDDISNRMGNIQYIKSDVNNRKDDKVFEEWLTTRNDSYYINHYIPRLNDYSNKLEFIEKREDKMINNIINIQNYLLNSSEPITDYPNKIF